MLTISHHGNMEISANTVGKDCARSGPLGFATMSTAKIDSRILENGGQGMKVILVESDLIGRLETLVNGAIEKFTPERVVDIKYSSAIDGRCHEHYYSAMVILKDEEGKKDG